MQLTMRPLHANNGFASPRQTRPAMALPTLARRCRSRRGVPAPCHALAPTTPVGVAHAVAAPIIKTVHYALQDPMIHLAASIMLGALAHEWGAPRPPRQRMVMVAAAALVPVATLLSLRTCLVNLPATLQGAATAQELIDTSLACVAGAQVGSVPAALAAQAGQDTDAILAAWCRRAVVGAVLGPVAFHAVSALPVPAPLQAFIRALPLSIVAATAAWQLASPLIAALANRSPTRMT